MNEMIVKTDMASTVRAFLLRLALAGGAVLGFAMLARGETLHPPRKAKR